MTSPLPLALLLSGILPVRVAAPPRTVVVAPGVYLFETAPHSDVGLDGNAVAIVSTDGVLVFDANGTPDAARAVLAKIHKLTRQPVRYLVLSHWHWDHWYGAEVYRKAYPGITIVSHRVTRDLMLGPALAFNQPGLDDQIPGHIKAVQDFIAQLAAKDPKSPRLSALQRHMAEDQAFLTAKRNAQHTVATLTFDDSLTIHLGERVIDVMHVDRAITPGDAFLYLPADKVLITGDLLVNPITFALGSYPAGWIATLARLDSLEVQTIVPGHGDPMHDKKLLEATLATVRELRRLGREAYARSLDVDSARAAIIDSIRPLRAQITHGDAGLEQQFEIYLVDWLLHRVYEEAEGPLSDSIAVIPKG